VYIIMEVRLHKLLNSALVVNCTRQLKQSSASRHFFNVSNNSVKEISGLINKTSPARSHLIRSVKKNTV
jgi:hypothetical protein